MGKTANFTNANDGTGFGSVRTAVIPAAGLGTRFLPITRAVPKEMLPLGSRPALELLVDEARAAGAERIVLVISHAKELVRTYFKDAPDVVFAYQEEQRGLGHAVLQAADAFPDAERGAFLILLGDAVVLGCAASSEMAALSRANGGAAVIGCERVPPEKVSRYGILKLSEDGARVIDLVEKPSLAEAPSDLAVAGRYLLPGEVFGYLRSQTPGKGGEIQLTDAIRRMVSDGCTLLPYAYPGKRHDIGNPQGYFETLVAFNEEREK